MKKTKTFAFGKDVYLLGADRDGVYYWLEAARWDCGWYWGGGYVETYANNKKPSVSRDINSHSHFDSMFLNGHKNGHDVFKEFFAEHPFSDGEIWKICELMRSFYIAREYSDMLYRGGAHYTTNPARDVIKEGAEEYTRINKRVIPEIMRQLYAILSGEEA